MRPHLASLVEEFRRNAAETAVVEHRGNRRYATTYGELAALAGRFAAELDRRGIGAGERVVLWGANSAEWIGAFFGCLLRGAIAVPLDAAGSADFARRVVEDVRPRLVVGDGELLQALSVVRSPFSVEGESGGAVTAMELRGIAEQLPAEPLWTVSDAVNQSTAFQIVFTSGTTAEPRGIVHTHRNVLVTLDPIEREMAKYRKYERIFHPLRFLQSLPLSHVFGQFMGLWCPALLGAEVHFAEQLEPGRMTDLMRRERISVLVAVPRVLQLLRVSLLARFPELQGTENREQGTEGPPHLRGILGKWWRFRRVHRALGWKFWAVISGGATLPAELEAFWNRLGYALIQGYGMTETAALVTLNHPFHIAPGTIGKTMPGREVKLTDEGEIMVRGAMLSEATWQGGAMHAREGEWLATGDLAAQSDTGELKFLGRKGDVIVTGAGMNIHPADLEAALAAQPGVRAAAVVACDLAGGTEPVAVVVFAGSDAELNAAVAAANRGLAEFQQMRRVLRWPELTLPYTSTGKLIRRQVAGWACDALSVDGSAVAHPQQGDTALLGLIGEVTGEAAPTSLRDVGHTGNGAVDIDGLRLSEDLHLDSLGRVQLQSALEQRFDVEIDDDAIAAVETVRELRRLVEQDVVRSPFSVVRSGPQSEGALRASDNSRPTETADRTTENGERRTDVYPRWPWSWPVRAIRAAFIECAMRPMVWLLAKPRVRYVGDANGEQTTGNGQPVLIVCNHVTAFDGALVLYALPGRLRRRVAAAMSGEMLMDFRRARNQGNWFLNLLAPAAYWLLTALFNVFPLPRGSGFRRSFAHAGEAMDHGYSVLIFPEGTRSLVGHMNAFRPGIGLLAEQSRVPIVPVALLGMYEAAAEGARWFRTGKMEVRVGAPIPVAAQPQDPAELTAMLERRLHELLEEQAQGLTRINADDTD